jgi:uncharacterized protein (TIGR00730 family)
MKSVAVYCGSSSGLSDVYQNAAHQLGELIARDQLTLVYGGGHVGLMGEVADAALASGGHVHGVITRALMDAEVGHRRLTTLEVVATMHERKARMAELADGFIALPGGFGTYEELFEVLTWAQLGIHAKPVVVVNINGFWDPLILQASKASDEGFMKPAHRDLLRVAATPEEALTLLRSPLPPLTPKWVDPKFRA